MTLAYYSNRNERVAGTATGSHLSTTTTTTATAAAVLSFHPSSSLPRGWGCRRSNSSRMRGSIVVVGGGGFELQRVGDGMGNRDHPFHHHR